MEPGLNKMSRGAVKPETDGRSLLDRANGRPTALALDLPHLPGLVGPTTRPLALRKHIFPTPFPEPGPGLPHLIQAMEPGRVKASGSC
jgi:hypothetical protein